MATGRVEKRERFTIGAGALLVLSMALAMGLFLEPMRETDWWRLQNVVFLFVIVLAGPTAIGVPWLIVRKLRGRFRYDRRWGPGRLHWFAQGSAAWLLWPPIVSTRLNLTAANAGMGSDPSSTAQICYFYGTPLMAVYMLIALAVGGRIRLSKKSRRRIDWMERFGLLLAFLWTSVGAFLHWLIYTDRIR
jgi:hypothetical protein